MLASRISTMSLYLLLSLPLFQDAVAQDRVMPMVLHYERSGPTAEAANYAEDPAPDLGAAHKISLASNIGPNLTEKQLRQLRVYGPWLTEDGLSNNAQTLIRTIQNIRIHGLNPERYQLTRILRTVDELYDLDRRPLQMAANNGKSQPATQSTQTPPAKSSDTDAAIRNAAAMAKAGQTSPLPGVTPIFALSTAKTEQLPGGESSNLNRLRQSLSRQLDYSFKKIIGDLGQGVVNGRDVQSKLYRKLPTVNSDAILQAVKQGDSSVAQAIKSVVPKHESYHRLTHHLRDLLTELQSNVKRTQVPKLPGSTADTYVDQQLIAQRLYEVGLLQLVDVFDVSATKVSSALRKFQNRHGHPETGKADKRTRLTLNRSVEQEIDLVALNLERWRWMPRELGQRHIFVNIPDYRVEHIENSITTLSMTAVVGSQEHQTPSFSRDMSYMEFNPTWTVPAKITNSKLIPLERRKPGYLKSRQFRYLQRRNGHLYTVADELVSRADFNKNPFPYVLQQQGGPINALGKMKFMMPNPYAIYLHDTQIKRHFTLNDRAFSHGCIRLHKPEVLARLLMSLDGMDEQTINKKIHNKATHRVRLRNPVPTHLAYFTSWVDTDGNLQSRPDIYEHDEPLLTALKSANLLAGDSARLF
jgi:murein L,D-transpeptidase YcbB/YkuD